MVVLEQRFGQSCRSFHIQRPTLSPPLLVTVKETMAGRRINLPSCSNIIADFPSGLHGQLVAPHDRESMCSTNAAIDLQLMDYSRSNRDRISLVDRACSL